MAALSQEDAELLLETLKNDSDLQIVSYGAHAVDLQLPDAPSPHAVNLEASYSAGALRLAFHMDEATAQRQREWLFERAQARGVKLTLSLVPG